MLNLSKELNKEQIEACQTIEGPIMVIAGAGSGKTRVLTYRVAYLISEAGIVPSSILAITFTNKAALEIKERLSTQFREINMLRNNNIKKINSLIKNGVDESNI